MTVLRRPRRCDGCRHLAVVELRPLSARCPLGYKLRWQRKHVPHVGNIDWVMPAEPCPKPRTWHEWLNTPPKHEEANQ